MKKIQTKITLLFVLSAMIASVVNGALGIGVTRYSTIHAIQTNLVETAEVAALAAQNMMATYTATVGEIALNSTLTSGTASPEELRAFLQQRTEAYYMRSGGLADRNGYDALNQTDVSAEPFFQKAMGGASYLSSPYITDDGSDAYLVVSAPVVRNGVVDGVVYFQCDTYLLQSIIESVQIGELGSAYILNQDGTTIAYTDPQLVLDQENAIAQAAANPKDKDLQALSAIEQKMVAGQTGIDEYSYASDGTRNLQAYTPIPSTDGWSIAVTIDEDEFMRAAKLGNLAQLACFAVLLVIVVILSRLVSRSLAGPIRQCASRLRLLAQGDLQSPVPQVRSKDELRILADSTGALVQNLRQIVDEIGAVLGSIAGGNLTRDTRSELYPGDFSALQDHLQMINRRLNHTMSGIVSASEQIAGGAAQVASTGSILAQGTTEQAGAVDELSSTITEICAEAENTMRLAGEAWTEGSKAGKQLKEGSAYIASLNGAMEHITTSSDEIGKIIGTIENIAFQTNILALNAAVEAARAGSSGKGFAVVADEVRNLATKSDQAAKATKELIERSMSSVSEGSDVVEKVTQSVSEVLVLAGEAVSKMGEVSEAVEHQNRSISQMTQHIDQISSVVQTNSATAEQSAATSQELSGQSDSLNHLVRGFTLREEDSRS